MQPVDRFALDTHDGPCETWPSRTHVLVDGVRSALAVSGYVLLRQFETPAAYLLVTDYDCPFEEAVTFTLVSKDPMRVRARRTVGAMYASCRLDAEHPTAVVVVAPSKLTPIDADKDWFRARGGNNAYLPWWGRRHDARPASQGFSG
ncbi:virulence factor [Burkholderia seminalis]|nr:virulence factor [Burkholderia seminalis]